MLLFALERSRAQFAWKCGGLDAAGLQQAPPAVDDDARRPAQAPRRSSRSATIAEFLTGRAPWPPWSTRSTATRTPTGSGATAADDSPEELYALWRGAVERSRAAWTQVLADGGPTSRRSSRPSTGESPNLRRVLVDLHDEYARHVGHADLFREAIDGLVGEPAAAVTPSTPMSSNCSSSDALDGNERSDRCSLACGTRLEIRGRVVPRPTPSAGPGTRG